MTPAALTAPAPVQPFLRFSHSEELRTRTLAVLDAIEGSPDPVKHRDALSEIVVELTNAGLDAYFMEPLKRADAGFITWNFASVGMGGARQVMASVIRSIVGRMDGPPLVSLCGSIRQFMA